MRIRMHIDHIMKAYNLNTSTLFIFLLVSFSFQSTYKYMIPLIVIVVLFQIYKVYKNKNGLYYLLEKLIYLLIFSLVFFRSIHSLLLIATIIISFLCQKNIRLGWSDIPKKAEITVLLFFLIIFFNLSCFGQNFKGLETYLYLLFYPILFLSLKKCCFLLSITKIIRVFITSVLISLIYLLIINLCYSDNYMGINTYFADYIDMSHVYYGMFLGLSFCLVLFLKSKNEVYISKNIDILVSFILLLCLIYIGARMALLAVIFISIYVIYKKLKFLWFQKLIITFFVFSTIVLLSFKFIPRVKTGVDSVNALYESIKTNNEKELVFNSWRNMNQRYLVWSYSLQEIKKNFLFGIGLKNVKTVISNKIIKDGYLYFQPINTHNQYLQFLLGLGVFGFLYFLFLLKRSASINVYFFLFFTIILLTESIFVRAKGMSLFFIFYFLFSYKNKVGERNKLFGQLNKHDFNEKN